MGAVRVREEDDAERSGRQPAKVTRDLGVVRLTAGEHYISVAFAARSESWVDVHGEMLGVPTNVARHIQPARPLHRSARISFDTSHVASAPTLLADSDAADAF